MSNSKNLPPPLLTELEQLRQRVNELEAAEARRKRVETELRARAHQQAVVAELGQEVLAGIELPDLLDKAAKRLAETLKAEFAQVLELLPDRDLLLLRAGVGWRPELIGEITIDARPDSHMGYTLFSSEPVILEDVHTDSRFSESALLLDHGVASGMSVIIDGEEWPFGVLGVYTTRPRTFTQDDINFLQAAANVLATAAEQRRAQQALQEAHDKLEMRVKERTAELQTANEELRTFAYIVSHDLRAPLVNIKGFAGELKMALSDIEQVIQEVKPQLNESQRRLVRLAMEEDIPEAMGFINSSVSRMNNLINAILKLSRLGRRELAFEPINMNDLVQTTLETLAHQIDQQQVTIEVGELPTIIADQTALEQIMGNILSNAVAYLEPSRPGHIEIEAENNHREYIFHIRDNGRGIAPGDMHKVFELFRRAGQQNVPGEGMGLAYVRTLIRRHGGRIWCQSEVDVGTTFSVAISNQLKQGENYE